jgi:hypothetical protein
MQDAHDFEWTHPRMTLRSGAELQAARTAAAERFTAIAMNCVPEGYTIQYRKSLSGRRPGTSPGHPQVALHLLGRVRPCTPAPGPEAEGPRPRDGS